MIRLPRLLLSLALLAAAPLARADAIRVFAPSVVRAAIAPIIERFQTDSGHTVTMEYGGTGLLLGRLKRGEVADVLVLPADKVGALSAEGRIVAGSPAEVGAVGIGVAVAEGAPLPDIGTPAALRQVLLDARHIGAIAPGNSTSGQHFAQVLEQLGIAEQVRPKLVLIDHGYVAERVARGEADIGIQQITEILPVKGARLAGPLPAALQKTTAYVAAVYVSSPRPEAAAGFVRALVSPAAQDAFRRHGFLVPAQGSLPAQTPE